MVDIVNYIDLQGMYLIVNPFLFIFIIFYASLAKTEVISKKEGVNIIIAMIIAALAVVPQVTGVGPNIVPYINGMVPLVALLVVMSVCLFILMALFGMEPNARLLRNVLLILVIIELILPDFLIAALVARHAGFEIPQWLGWLASDWFIMSMVILGVFGALVAYISKDTK